MRIVSLVAVFAVSMVGWAGSASAHASEMRIGLVDMQKALQSVEAGKKAKAELESEVEAKRKAFQKEEASIKRMGDEFKKQSLVMSDEARSKKQSELQDRVMKLQEQGQKTEQDLHQREQELTQPILNKLRDVIVELAKEKGYDMVLEKNDSTVLFSHDKDDLTQDVVTAFNKKNG